MEWRPSRNSLATALRFVDHSGWPGLAARSRRTRLRDVRGSCFECVMRDARSMRSSARCKSRCLSVVSCGVAILAVAICSAAWANEPVSPASSHSRDAVAGQVQIQLLCVHAVATGDSLPVRSGPGLHQSVTGRLGADDCGIRLVGACRDGWCEMARGEVRGWVDTRYVGIYELPMAASSASAIVEAPAAVETLPTPRAESQATKPDTRSDRGEAADREPQVAPDGGRQALNDRTPQSTNGSHARTGACVARVSRGDTLRMRSGPGVGHSEIGGIPPGACSIERVGGCRGSWCPVAWRGRSGWVNSYYLQ